MLDMVFYFVEGFDVTGALLERHEVFPSSWEIVCLGRGLSPADVSGPLGLGERERELILKNEGLRLEGALFYQLVKKHPKKIEI